LFPVFYHPSLLFLKSWHPPISPQGTIEDGGNSVSGDGEGKAEKSATVLVLSTLERTSANVPWCWPHLSFPFHEDFPLQGPMGGYSAAFV